MRDRITILRLAFHVFSLLPARWSGALGAGLGRLAYYADKKHRLRALANLALVYPEKDRGWREHVARESFAEAGRTFMEMPHVFLAPKAFLRSRIEVQGEENLRQALALERGVILVGLHYANWELGAISFSLLGYPSANIYRAIPQAPADIYLKRLRSRFGAEMHARREPMGWLPRRLKQGYCVALMIDQHISEEHGITVPFLGHPASTTTLPAALALRKGIPVIPVQFTRRDRDFRFVLRFLPVVQVADNEADPLASFTERMNDAFAPVIHARPELWLWAHRRWRTLENAGKVSP